MLRLERRPQQSKVMAWASPVIAVILMLISGALLFMVLDRDPVEGLYTFWVRPLIDFYSVTELFVKAAPILLCAIGLSVVYRAQIWNIGAEGQLLIGALGGGYIALKLMDAQGLWVLPMVLIAGILSGMLWALLAAWLKTAFNANEILTTIMLNYIALNLVVFSVYGPLKDPQGYNFPQSAFFSYDATLPILFDGTRIHIGIIFALIGVAITWTLLSKAFLGFQIKVMGLDASAAKMAGFREKRLTWIALGISGAFAGLAGVSEVTGPIGQLLPNISPGYGYAAIIVAFLGRLHPVGILLATLLMALIYMGGEMAQMNMGLPVALTGLFQGMLLFYLLACDVLINYRVRVGQPVPVSAS